MDREQAEKALAIIRDVIQNTRDDLAVYNWGVVWMVHSFVHFAACSAGAWLQSQPATVLWYLAPLTAATAIDIIIVLILTERDRGASSFVERQLWAVWITFAAFTVAAALVLHAANAPANMFAPIFALHSGIAFATQGIIFDRRFFALAVMFLVGACLAAVFPIGQWWIIGVLWWFASMVPGVILHRQKKQLTSVQKEASRVL